MLRTFASCCKLLFGDASQSISPKTDPALVGFDFDATVFVCPNCRSKGHFKSHGSYERNYIYSDSRRIVCRRIKIARVKCLSCGVSHALLPLTVVPHCQYSLVLIAFICKEYLERVHSSLEALAAHYEIPLPTAINMVKRFRASTRIALGITDEGQGILWLAKLLSAGALSAVSSFLESYSKHRGRSFCEMKT